MIKRYHGFDIILNKSVYKSIIKGYALFVDHSFGRHNSRPRHRKTVGVKPEFFHERNVLFIPVIVIACNVARLIAITLFIVRKIIPYTWSFAVLVPTALYLIGRGSRTPHKIVFHILPPLIFYVHILNERKVKNNTFSYRIF